MRGVCADDSDCEHAFHVIGAADGFVLRGSRVRDFNAQLKVNASMIGGGYVHAERGLVEYNELCDTRARRHRNPVTKLNIDTGDDWVIRGNYIHDCAKERRRQHQLRDVPEERRQARRSSSATSSSARRDTTGGTRIGLSFGGGGTAPQFCAPAFDANTPCSVEHDGGTMRNNIIANCSDVGIYLNRGKDTNILYNTLIATAGIDFRFDTTTR